MIQWATSYTAASQWALQDQHPGGREVFASANIGEQQDATLLARINTKLNQLVLQADVYQVVVRVFDNAGTEVYGTELSPADAIFDGIQTGPKWTTDSTGFNLAIEIPGRGVLTTGGALYTTEVMVEMSDGDTIFLRGTLKVAPALTTTTNQIQ